MSGARSFRVDASWSTAGTIGLRCAGALGGIASARLLGPSGKGEAALAVVVGSIVGTAATGGLQFWVIPEVARSGAAVAWGVVVAHLRRLVLAGGALLAAVVAGVAWRGGPVGLVLATGLLAGAWVVSALVLAVVNGHRDMRRLALATTVGGAANLVGVALLVVLDRPSVALVVSVAALANLAVLPITWAAARPDVRASPDDARVAGRTALRTGVPNCLSELVGLAASRADLVVVAAVLGGGDAGRYAVAVALCELLLVVPDGVAQVLMPHVAGGATTSDVARIVRIAAAATLAGGLVLVALSGTLLPLVFGEGFRGSADALPGLVVAATSLGAWRMVAADAVARGATTARLVSSALGLVVVAATGPALVARWELVGAGAAAAAGAVVALGVLVRVRARHLRSVGIEPRPALAQGVA